jgi:hypothetical protein
LGKGAVNPLGHPHNLDENRKFMVPVLVGKTTAQGYSLHEFQFIPSGSSRAGFAGGFIELLFNGVVEMVGF